MGPDGFHVPCTAPLGTVWQHVPTVVCYCQDFLKPDMQHVHRQIMSLSRWQPAVITQKRENAGQFPFPNEKKRLTVLPRLPWRNLRRAWFRHVKREPLAIPAPRVQQLIFESLRCDARVVHIFFGHIGVQLLPFIAASPRPVVVSFHGADVGVDARHPAWQAALQQVFARSALILARSESLLEGLKKLGCPDKKLRLQRTGIPLDAWPWQARLHPADDAWHFVQACRLVPKKGLRTTLRAFQEIAARYPKASMTMAGDGPLLEELHKAAAAAGLAGRVHFPGFLGQEALRRLVYSAHAFFHPSETPADGNREGVPNALLEAMASGLPVLATRHGGIPEAVTHGHSGYLTAEGDAPALARAAFDLTADPSRYQKMSAAAAAEVATKFERKAQTAILESYYDEASGSKL
jgi:colanic acid/amylovoran biosynthesis glycosyltransferase